MTSQLLSVQSEELKFQFELERQSYCDLKVTNSTEHHVAFKVKTTSPRKYFVRPNTGIILPMDSCIITVTMQAPREYPPDMQCKDKFLLLSTIVSPSAESDGIPQDTFNKDGEKTIEECKLRVVYTLPPGHGNSGDNPFFTPNSMLRSSRLHSDTNSMHSSSSFEDIQALTRLKEERDAAIQQHQQLKQELEMLKRRRSHRSNEGFSVMFAGLVGVVGVLVGLIINVALSPSK